MIDMDDPIIRRARNNRRLRAAAHVSIAILAAFYGYGFLMECFK